MNCQVIVGTAEVLIRPVTTGFEDALKAESDAGFTGFRKDAQKAGEDAGANLRTGVTDHAGKLESDLGSIGAASGVSLRKGVAGESSKLAGDLEKEGARGGEGLSKGIGGGLAKLGTLISSTGLPLGGLSSGLQRAGDAAKESAGKAGGLEGKLSTLGGAALKVGAVALVAVGAGALDAGEKMQRADASIAAAAGTSAKAAALIGTAFEGTAFKSEFSSVQMATAFASVAGQLKATQGSALNSAQAMKVMGAASDLATAKQIDLGTATSTLAGVMQAFQLKSQDAAHVSDVLFSASTATGQSVDGLASSLERVRSKLGDTAGSVGQLSGLLVDMTEQGITGRAAMGALNTATTTLTKSQSGTGAAAAKTRDEFKALGLSAFNSKGDFVGMGAIVDQLHPKFAKMTEQQRLQTAATLFGAGAARQMTAIITAGPAALDKATASVNRHGAAQTAAGKQSQTLGVEVKTLEAGFVDLAAKIGAVLIPIITSMVGAFIKATSFVTQHKAILITLAAVVTGVLGTAIGVFTVNKMAQFAQSFVQASQHVKNFASDVQSVVSKVIGLFTKQTAASDAAATSIQTNAEKSASATTAAAGTMEADNTTTGASFGAVGTEAGVAAGEVDTAVATEATAVTAADATIEADNAAAGASFSALAGAAGALGLAGGVAVAGTVAGNAIANATGAPPFQQHSLENHPGAATNSGGGVNIGPIHIGGPGGAILNGLFGGHATGAKVTTPSYMVGEEAPQHPEYVIATNPAYRSKNLALHAAAGSELGVPGFARGGRRGRFQLPSNATGQALINDIVNYGLSIGASSKEILAAVETALVEQPALDNGAYGDGTSVGWRQETAGSYGAAVGPRLDLRNTIPAFYAEERSGNLAGSAGQLAQSVQRSAYPSRYDAQQAAAQARIASASKNNPLPVHVQSIEPAYVNPLGRATGVHQNRTDMGIDYTATPGSAIQALGAGFIDKIIPNWYHGQPLIEEKLTQGPQAGKFVYYAEQLNSLVREGQSVKRGQTIATVASSGTGLELGLGAGGGRTLAQATTGYSEGQVTPAGRQYGALLSQIASGTAGNITVSGLAAQAPALTAAQLLPGKIALEKSQVATEIARLKASLIPTITGTIDAHGHAHEVKVPPSAEAKQKVAIEIATIKAGLAITIADQKTAVGQSTRVQQAEAHKQTTDLKAGTSQLNKLLSAIHSGSLKSLQSALFQAHLAGLGQLERSLDHDHSSALSSLSKQLVSVHAKALGDMAKAQAQANAAAAVAARTTLLGREATDVQRTAADQAREIAAATKIFLDKQSAATLSGTALVAANAQTSLDQITATNDAAISAAQAAVDNAASGSALAQAQAGFLLAQAQATATVQEALAQSVLDKATAAANTSGATATTNNMPINLNIYGNGQMTPAQLFTEIGFAISTGALPVAPPPAVPAAA